MPSLSSVPEDAQMPFGLMAACANRFNEKKTDAALGMLTPEASALFLGKFGPGIRHQKKKRHPEGKEITTVQPVPDDGVPLPGEAELEEQEKMREMLRVRAFQSQQPHQPQGPRQLLRTLCQLAPQDTAVGHAATKR